MAHLRKTPFPLPLYKPEREFRPGQATDAGQAVDSPQDFTDRRHGEAVRLSDIWRLAPYQGPFSSQADIGTLSYAGGEGELKGTTGEGMAFLPSGPDPRTLSSANG